MSGDIGRQTSSEVAHEAEDTRAHLASTLEQLRDNLKPANVMEEVVTNARVGASSVAEGVVSLTKAHPFPAILIATGAALILGVTTRGRGRQTPPRSRPRAEMLREPATFGSAPGRHTPTSPSVTSRVAGTAAAVKDSIGDYAAKQASQLSDTMSGLGHRVSDAYDATSSNARDAMNNASRYIPHDTSEVKSKLSNLLEEQPLVLGAIGLAIGAAIGAAIPMTRTEDDWMGSTAHSVRQAAQDTARQEVAGLQSAASEAFENVKKAASEHGLSKDNLTGLVHDVGEHARTAVNHVGSSLNPAKDAG